MDGFQVKSAGNLGFHKQKKGFPEFIINKCMYVSVYYIYIYIHIKYIYIYILNTYIYIYYGPVTWDMVSGRSSHSMGIPTPTSPRAAWQVPPAGTELQFEVS